MATPKPPFAIVRDCEVPWPIKGTLIVLALHHPTIYATQDRLAWERGVHRSTINRHLRQLEAAGLIRKQQRTGTSTRRYLNLRAIRAYKPAATATDPSRVDEAASSASNASAPKAPTDLPF